MKFKRTERIGAIVKILSDNPNKIYTLSYFTETFNAAKSTISEDLLVVKNVFEKLQLGKVITISGAAGGVKYIPKTSIQENQNFLMELCEKISSPDRVLSGRFLYLIDLIYEDNICYGGILKNSSKTYSINSKFTILATGGIGGIFTSTTNVEYLTGDGLNISLKNNISIKDMEYLQLHPTVLYEPKVKGKKLLLSESLRGEGGIILNQNKEQFIDSLLPRDIVSSAILKEIESTPNKPYVYLDMTKKSKDFLIDRFPFLYNECLKRGYEMDKDLLPIAPAHHYCMGGIKVDLFSKTSMNNLYAVGEVSCTGVHGSNRLASNSLLEALVFGKQAAENINSKINEISFKEIIKEPKSYALDSYEELIKFLKEKVDNRYAKLFNC